MAGPDEGIWYACPKCGASNVAGTKACFLCGHRLDPSAPPPRSTPAPIPGVNPYAPPDRAQAGGGGGSGGGFRIDSMLLVIALIAVCMGVIHEAPGLGIPLAIVSFIAYARTVIVSSSMSAGRPSSVGDKLAVFFATVGVAVIVLLCIAIALLATCFAICSLALPREQTNFGVPVPLVLLLAFVAFCLLLAAARVLQRVGTVPRDRNRPGGGPRSLR